MFGGLVTLVSSARVAVSSLITSSGNDPSSVMLALVTSLIDLDSFQGRRIALADKRDGLVSVAPGELSAFCQPA